MKEKIEKSGPVQVDPALAKALEKIEEFVENATGAKPTPEELAPALTKYFVLKEILEFVRLSREASQET